MSVPFDLVIVGGGPAGAAASVYAARKRMKTLLITAEWGGQSVVSERIENWIGTPAISGKELAEQLKKHVETYQGEWLTILSPARATGIRTADDSVTVLCQDGSEHTARALLIAAGAARRTLDVPGAKEYEQKGLTYCASCDGPVFAGMDVAVVGGGNAAFETAAQLSAYCKSVTLINRSDAFRADAITVEKVLAKENVRALTSSMPTAVTGEAFVTGLSVRDCVKNEESTIPVQGIFVEIGLVPNTAWLSNAVILNNHAHIIADPRTQRTSHPRIWAAGDIADGAYHQNNIAAGDAVKALEDIYATLNAK